MGKGLLVDTNVFVDCLRGHLAAADFLERNADRILLSAIVVAELYAGARNPQEQATVDAVVSCFPVLPVTGEIARAAGALKRDYGKSHGVGLADAILAATAQAHDAQLVTLNVRHYPMIPALLAPYAKD